MIATANGLYQYRELIGTLIWKGVVLRYKQAYLGMAWALAKPLMLMLIFTVMRAFIGIDSGGVPYPVLAFCALLPWMLVQESVADGVQSVVSNAHLIKKIYFPREIFPLAAVLTRVVDFAFGFVILIALMVWYGIAPGVQALWVPVLVAYTLLTALALSLAGSAINVYYRDIGQVLPVMLALMMYASPVIYPLHLVEKKLLVEQAAGPWSNALFTLFTANPMAGIIDAFQNVLLRGQPPNLDVMLPGMIVVAALLPLAYLFFKRAEADFADVI